jgi:hydroxymethylbilane synthase
MLRIGTRGSQLALWQAHTVAARIATSGGPPCTIVTIKTSGDRLQEAPLSDVGGKRLFVKEIEDALLGGDIDLAVHSSKDMPAVLPDGLQIAAVLPREDPLDAIVLPSRVRLPPPHPALPSSTKASATDANDPSSTTNDRSHAANNPSQVTDGPAQVANDLSDVTDELSHVSNDAPQVATELSRVANELSRVTNELSHVSNELSRVASELSHVTNDFSQVTNAPDVENDPSSLASGVSRTMEAQTFATVADLVAGLGQSPVIGTGSVRRIAQLTRLIPGARFTPIRGNLDTRLRKLDAGDYDVLVLAAAGLVRLGLASRISMRLPATACVPAPGQGIVAIEIRAGDEDVRRVVARIDDPAAAAALNAERALVTALGGGCQTPIGALASPVDGHELELIAVVVSPDGSRAVRGEARGRADHAAELGQQVAAKLVEEGAEAILADARSHQSTVDS